MGIVNMLKDILTVTKQALDIQDSVSGRFSFKTKHYPHYFENYHKHVTVYNDGTGVIINEFDLVFNKQEIQLLKRGISIMDGGKDASFPPLDEMLKVKIPDRFSKSGFWLYSEDNIISSTTENYQSNPDDIGAENMEHKNNPKILEWVFRFNYSNIQPNRKYKVIYVISIPSMYPIKNGVIDKNNIFDQNLLNDLSIGNSSSLMVKNPIHNFYYTISFESGILLQVEPRCSHKLGSSHNSTHLKLHHEYNTIYNKYHCKVTKPKIGSVIKIEWQFKEE